MSIKKIYANDYQHSLIVCDQCGKTKEVNLSTLTSIAKNFKVKCPCGHTFFVDVEIRKYYRKETRLAGTYTRLNPGMASGAVKGQILVEDLSRRGIGFRTQDRHNMQAGETLEVRFFLDDKKRSEIIKSVLVKNVRGLFIGAEFLDYDSYNNMNRLLGAYLLPS